MFSEPVEMIPLFEAQKAIQTSVSKRAQRVMCTHNLLNAGS